MMEIGTSSQGAVDITVRIEKVATLAGCEACRRIAVKVWGGDAASSSAQMIVHAMYGGIVLLAIEGEFPVGFLFSFPAQYRGEWVLWSHETAVLPTHLHRGIGYALKRFQQVEAKHLGYSTIAWTFDPLVARNAYFNLEKLGATVSEYKRNVYGVDEEDRVNQGIETDRFVATWPTALMASGEPNSEASGDTPAATIVPSALSPLSMSSVLTTTASGGPQAHLDQIAGGNAVSTDIPGNFAELIVRDRATASAWRNRFREAAETLLQRGYRPMALERGVEKSRYIWIP